MKKIKKIKIAMLGTNLILTYGRQNYTKYFKDTYGIDKTFEKGGVNTTLEGEDLNGKIIFENVIGLTESDDILGVKGMLVHELNHTVTSIMKQYDIEDDEFRSYLLQYLYLKSVKFLDKILH